jgi:hypothetical protein
MPRRYICLEDANVLLDVIASGAEVRRTDRLPNAGIANPISVRGTCIAFCEDAHLVFIPIVIFLPTVIFTLR